MASRRAKRGVAALLAPGLVTWALGFASLGIDDVSDGRDDRRRVTDDAARRAERKCAAGRTNTPPSSLSSPCSSGPIRIDS